MRSIWSLSVLMIAVAGLGIGFAGQRPSPAAYVIAALLVLAGLAMISRRPAAYLFGLGVAGVMVVSGLVALLGHPRLSLPVPPLLSIVVGLYLGLRIAMAKAALGGRRPYGTLPEEPPPAARPGP